MGSYAFGALLRQIRGADVSDDAERHRRGNRRTLALTRYAPPGNLRLSRGLLVLLPVRTGSAHSEETPFTTLFLEREGRAICLFRANKQITEANPSVHATRGNLFRNAKLGQ